MPNPFAIDKPWLRGNLHTHTTNSDGACSPERTVEIYAEGGYDFLAITDHDVITDVEGLQGQGVTVLPAAEVAVGLANLGQTIHVVALGASVIPDSYSASHPPAPEALATFTQWCEMCIIGHPFWSLLELADLLPLEGYIGVEVYNTTCHYGSGRGPSEMMWDSLLAHGRQVWGLAVDDSHREHDCTKGWVLLKAEDDSPPAIYAALRAGLFYSSTGPEIYDVQISGDQVQVACSPCQEVAVIGLAPGVGITSHRLEVELPIEHIQLPLSHPEISVRIECIDEAGHKAWTNPFFP